MRKLEGLTKEIVDELGYLKKREERFTDTNRTCAVHKPLVRQLTDLPSSPSSSINKPARAEFCHVLHILIHRPGGVDDLPHARVLQAQVLN